MLDAPELAVVAIGTVSVLALALAVWNTRRQETRMRRRLEAVQAAEAEVRRLLDELPEAVLLVDPEGVIHSTNAASLTLLGLSRRELIESDLVEHASSGEDQIQLGASIRRSFDGDRVDPIQIEIVAGATRRVVVEVSFHMPRSDSPSSSQKRLVVRLRDVSEREQQSRALDQARRRFQQAFQSAPTGMALVRLDDGRIVDANQSLADMLGRSLESLIGVGIRLIMMMTRREKTSTAA